VWWKRVLDVQRPYRWNIRRLDPGRTLDVGTGIGRHLRSLPPGSIGVDHNADSIAEARRRGLPAMTTTDFEQERGIHNGQFDCLLFSHLIEHLEREDAVELVRSYLPCLRTMNPQRESKVILITPQEAGFASDSTHVHFFDFAALESLCREVGLEIRMSFSFPLPRPLGRVFKHNEFVVVASPTKS
jgi:SAM-dependent methyltransferase